jgi:hypothetical protein
MNNMDEKTKRFLEIVTDKNISNHTFGFDGDMLIVSMKDGSIRVYNSDFTSFTEYPIPGEAVNEMNDKIDFFDYPSTGKLIKLSEEECMRNKHCNIISDNCITTGCVSWENVQDGYGYCIDIESKKKKLGER